jgi:hypothetical protein
MATKTLSFKNNAANTAAAPAATNNEPEDVPSFAEENPNSGLTTIPGSQLATTGAADDVEPSDITLPKLKLLQGTSDKKLLQQHGFGALLLKDAVTLARPALDGKPAITGKMVFCRLLSKTYAEKPKKFGDTAGYATSLVEVEQLNGTTDWRESRENPRANSNKPWFQTVANCLLLVEQPEGVADDHFPFDADGKRYAPAIYSVKSFAYDAFFKTIATAKMTGELRKDGYASKIIEFTSEIKAGKGNAEFAVPSIKFGAPTSAELRTLASQF